MIVDDAVVVRGLVSRWIGLEPDMQVVRVCKNGREALEQLDIANPDVVVLDIEMPELEGIATLKEMLIKRPRLPVIMASTLTKRGAEITLKALSMGATDCVPKPDIGNGAGSEEFRRTLIDKIRHLGGRRSAALSFARREIRATPLTHQALANDVKLRPFSKVMPKAILVGSSTGGPQALQVLVKGLAPIIDRVPVMIVQHMPPIFTATLAEHLGRLVGKPAREAINGEPLKAGMIYIAPGGKHLALIRRDHGVEVVIDDSAPIHFCKPAVDALFLSASNALDGRALCIVLTGMGSDGKKGSLAIADNGGNVIAQDEATSVIWGMPGSAAHAGACAAVLPIQEIGPKAVRIVSGDFS
ncbi:MAG: chemotaxis response regulator protein-glutamate methylesterase [Xanthobacteraceae bacterium]|nr:chemotaxis response regulator protein-glutamate methylesterase [Xanthobacteraceae bacterium]